MEEMNAEMEKWIKVTTLYPNLLKYPMLVKYFDIESTKLLDKKIAVLESVAAGKTIDEIPDFYEIFELLPKDGVWD